VRHQRGEGGAVGVVARSVCGRGDGQAVGSEQRAHVGVAELDEEAFVDAYGDRPVLQPQRGELHRAPLSTSLRKRFSLAKIGASLNWKRSSAPESESEADASDFAENGTQDGTTNMSPRVTNQE
jgi:hypothetical protein